MDQLSNQEEAVELLQQLGLKEYEARSFVALTRAPGTTAKRISEISEVPRTRVYDAVRVLETKGLVAVQHSNPQRFRPVSIDEAIETLRAEYNNRMASLRDTLTGLDPVEESAGTEVTHEVWALSSSTGIATRTQDLVGRAEYEVLFVVGREESLTDGVIDELRAARDRGVTLLIGAATDDLRNRVEGALPGVSVFVSGLDWLRESTLPEDTTDISRLLLVDRESILVSSLADAGGKEPAEYAVYGSGFDNGIVAIVRRLIATGLVGSTPQTTDE